jgi:RNA polymerase sigma-70 factor (ECF subfamily)
MFRTFPSLRRWEETSDVFQNASIRLCRALEEVTPRTAADFFRLAALQIRRELIDLARHYFGPEGPGVNDQSLRPAADPEASTSREGREIAASTMDPRRLAAWSDFHEQAGSLPDEEREVFDLLWYQGLTQAEAAAVLKISERSLQRRWHQARVKLYRALDGRLPGE